MACQEWRGHGTVGEGMGWRDRTVHHWQKQFRLYTAGGTLTLHQELSHGLAAVGFHLVVAAVLLRGLVDDQHVLAAVFLEAILERLVSR